MAPRKPRHSAGCHHLPADRRPFRLAPVTLGPDGTSGNGCGPDKLRAFAILANRRLSGFWPALITFGPDGISGNRFGPDTLRASVIFAKDGLRAHGPTCPPSAGQSPLLPLLPLSGKSGVPSPIRRTSPVMTNKRIRNLLDPARNAAVMAPPSADPYPADYPAVLSVSLFPHSDHLFDPAPNAKTRKAQGFAGFGPGAFIPLTFILCHK